MPTPAHDRCIRRTSGFALVLFLIAFAGPALAAGDRRQEQITCAGLREEIVSFLRREVGLYAADIKSLNPPPSSVLNARAGGDFTWGTFMRAVMTYGALSGDKTVGGRNLARFLGELGLVDARGGAKTFSQLAGALTLREYGCDLEQNAVWLALNPDERALWRGLLDPSRFYDRRTRKVIRLPENYLGVASRIVVIDYQLGLITDRSYVDDVLDRAAGQFLGGALYADDAVPNGRYDRYSQEYERFLYEAAEGAGRTDIMRRLEPALAANMRTWWALVGADGYGYPWGRTIGAVSYMDTLEIVAFLAQNPQFRPAPLADLAGVYAAAWSWLRRDYLAERHVLNVFGFGRGNFNYMTPDREWQQTTSFFYKLAGAEQTFDRACRAEGLASFRAAPELPEVARFEFFRRGDRPAGAWLVRQGPLRFVVPITTGTQSGIADYLPAPHGLPGFAAPVEQFCPALVPYVELPDGRIVVAGDGADSIEPAPDGRSLRVTWHRWALVKSESDKTEAEKLFGEAGKLVEPGLSTTVEWSLHGQTVVRRETLTAAKPVGIKRYWFVFTGTGDRVRTRFDNGRRRDLVSSPDGEVELAVSSPAVPFSVSIRATGDSAIGRGARTGIPIAIEEEAANVTLCPGTPFTWELQLTSLPH